MNIHPPVPSLLPHICSSCGLRDSDPTYHRTPVETVSPLRIPSGQDLPGQLEYVRAVARRTDPSTSWEAARSVKNLTQKQMAVLALFKTSGPMTDEDAAARYATMADINQVPPQSVSGFRTRRKELVVKGLMRDTGERRRGSSGQRATVWAAA